MSPAFFLQVIDKFCFSLIFNIPQRTHGVEPYGFSHLPVVRSQVTDVTRDQTTSGQEPVTTIITIVIVLPPPTNT